MTPTHTRPKRHYSPICMIAIILTVLLAACGQQQVASHQEDNRQPMEQDADGMLTFVGPDGRELASISIEIAETDPDREQGLMWRSEMAYHHGMLFIFKASGPRAFWMKNTYIPLDIIFVGKDKRVVHIAEDTTPLSRKIIGSPRPAMYVVEVNSGHARHHNIEEGTHIRWQRE